MPAPAPVGARAARGGQQPGAGDGERGPWRQGVGPHGEKATAGHGERYGSHGGHDKPRRSVGTGARARDGALGRVRARVCVCGGWAGGEGGLVDGAGDGGEGRGEGGVVVAEGGVDDAAQLRPVPAPVHQHRLRRPQPLRVAVAPTSPPQIAHRRLLTHTHAHAHTHAHDILPRQSNLSRLSDPPASVPIKARTCHLVTPSPSLPPISSLPHADAARLHTRAPAHTRPRISAQLRCA